MSHLRVSCSPSAEPLYPTLFSSSSSSPWALPVGLESRSLSALNEQMRSWCFATTSGSSVGATSRSSGGGAGGSSSAAALSAISALTRSIWSSGAAAGDSSGAASGAAAGDSSGAAAGDSSSNDTRRSFGGGGLTGSSAALDRSFFRSMISEMSPSRATGPVVARCAVGRASFAVSSRRSSSRSPSSSRASFDSATYRRLQLAHSATLGEGMMAPASRWVR